MPDATPQTGNWKRIVCRFRGHQDALLHTSLGNFTGYCEHFYCVRCGREHIVQVPQ